MQKPKRMDKYALLVRLNPEHFPTWNRHIQAGRDVWFKTGRLIPEEIQAGLRVVVLGTTGKGILAVGETASAVVWCPDPDWEEAPPGDQAECKAPQNRVPIRLKGLAIPVPDGEVKANSTIRHLRKRRETITWLKSDEYSSLMSLVAQNG